MNAYPNSAIKWYKPKMTEADLIKWCAEECERQSSGETSVYNLYMAVQKAKELSKASPLTSNNILTLASIIDPQNKGFRQTPVVFSNGNKGLNHQSIPRAINNLLDNLHVVTNKREFYQEFETIHPFQDGNGRLGAILYNWGNLHNLTIPPKYKVWNNVS